MDIGTIISLSLTGLFVLIILGLVISILFGLKKGVFKTSYRLLFILIFAFINIVTLDQIVQLAYDFPLSQFFSKTIVLANTNSGIKYYVPVTTLYETVYSSLEGYYVLFHASGSASLAAKFALSLAGTVIKLGVFIVEMILLAILGTFFSWLTWVLFFKHLIPRLARRIVKIRWAGALFNAVKYLVVVFLLISPFTSLVNIANQSYQNNKNESDNQMVTEIQSFLDIYNNSIFANTLFNWTTNDDGLTIDAQFLDEVTTNISEGATQSIVGEIGTITDIATALTGAITGENGFGFDITALLSEDVITSVFDSLISSNMIMTLIPIAATMALNSELLIKTIDTRLMQMSDVEWKAELENIEEFAIQIVNSGILDKFIDENGNFAINIDDKEAFVTEILDDGIYEKVIDALDSLMDSKILTRAMPSVMVYLADNDQTGQISKFLPKTVDEICDISWGFESYVLLKAVKRMYDVDNRVVHAIFKQFIDKKEESGDPVEPEPSLVLNEDSEVEEDYTLTDLLLDNYDEYLPIIIGDFNSDGEPVNVDNFGRTEVYKNGQKIEGREFCLMDMTVMKYLLEGGLDILPDMAINALHLASWEQEDKDYYNSVVDELGTKLWCKNYKKEFKAIFDVLGEFKNDKELVDALISGQVTSVLPDIEGNGKYFHIDQKHIDCATRALRKMDKSKLLYAFGYPVARSFLSSNYSEKISDYNIDRDLIKLGLVRCRDNHTIGSELAKILELYPEAAKLSDAYEARTSTFNTITNISKEYKSIAKILDVIYDCELVNPTPIEGDDFVKGQNYFNAMEYGLSLDQITNYGLTYHSEVETMNLKWTNSYDSNGEIILDGENGKIALAIKELGRLYEDKNVVEYVTDGVDFTKGETFRILENEYHVSQMLKAVARVKVFQLTLGEFLDKQCSPYNVYDPNRGVSFINVTDWDYECDNLHDVLISAAKIIDSAFLSGEFDIAAIRDVVTTNDILHALANSGIFTDKRTGEYKFGDWLFLKTRQYLSETELSYTPNGPTKYVDANLIKDPKSEEQWEINKAYWGDRNDPNEESFVIYRNEIHNEEWEDTYYLSYRDFAELDKSDWISPNFVREFDTSSYVTSEYAYYYDNPDFFDDYRPMFECDEIGRVSEAIFYFAQMLDGDLMHLTPDLVEDCLDTINYSHALRMVLYNFYDMLGVIFSDNKDATRGLGNFDAAYSTYMISADLPANQFDDIAALREPEIHFFTDVYRAYIYFDENQIFDYHGNFYPEKVDEIATNYAEAALHGLNESLVFHRKGSILRKDDGKYYPTVFQDTVTTVYVKCFAEIVYRQDSPKDTLYYDDYAYFMNQRIENESAINDIKAGKSDYIVNNFFTWEEGSDWDKQIEELDNIIQLGKCVSACDDYHGLKTASGKLTTQFSKVDYKNPDNVLGLFEALEIVNKTYTLFDMAPNGLAGALESLGNLEGLNMKTINVYYPYGNPSGVVTKESFDFEKHYSTSDLEAIYFLLDENCKYQNGSDNSLILSLNDLNEANFDLVEEFLNTLIDSPIFHEAGPKRVIDASNTYSIDITNNANGVTFLQEIFAKKIFSNSSLDIKVDGNAVGNYFYYSYDYTKDSVRHSFTSEKDLANSAFYNSVSSKSIYYAKTIYDYAGDIDAQKQEINNVIKAICSINGGTFHDETYEAFIANKDMSSASLNSISNGESFATTLKALNDSESFKDIVPNVLHYLFNNVSNEFGAMDKVHLSDIDVYYHYTNGHTSVANYDVKYDESEIDAYAQLIDDYKLFNSVFANKSDLNSISKMKQILIEDGNYKSDNYLYNLLVDAYAVQGMHSGSIYLNDSTHLTVFEQIVDQIIDSTNMANYVSDYSIIFNNIKEITALDIDSTLTSSTGYNDSWFTSSNNGGSESLLKFIFEGTILMDKLGFDKFNIVNMTDSFGTITPDDVKTILSALNGSDVIADAVPSFVKDAFETVGLKNLTTYGGTDYAYYGLTQYQYGGNKNDSDNEYTEINNLYRTLGAISKYDASSNFVGYYDVNNLGDFVATANDSPTKLAIIVDYTQTSMILSNGLLTIGGTDVDARALTMYNALADEGDVNLGTYIVGDNASEKIIALNSIYNFNIASWEDCLGNTRYGTDTKVEAFGLYEIIKDCTMLGLINTSSSTSFLDDNNIDLLENILIHSYNADGNNNRSYFSSAIAGGMLSEIMDSEASICNSLSYTFDMPQYEPISYNLTTLNSFDELNSNEVNSLVSALRLGSIFKSFPSIDGDNIETYFSGMVYNSKNGVGASVIYLANVHPILVAQGYSEVPSNTYDFFDGTVLFDAYGVSIANRLRTEGVIA